MPSSIQKITYRHGHSHPLLPPILKRCSNTFSKPNATYDYDVLQWHIRIAGKQRDTEVHTKAAKKIQRKFRSFRERNVQHQLKLMKKNNIHFLRQNLVLKMLLQKERSKIKKMELKIKGLLRIFLKRSPQTTLKNVEDLQETLHLISQIFEKKRHNLILEERQLKKQIIMEFME